MSAEEIETARANGIEPVRHVVALDAIAVVVHPSNPVNGLTLEQVVGRLHRAASTRWTAVGGEDRPIVLLSRESNSGTYVYFLEQVLRLGRKDAKDLFSPETLLMPSSEGISTEVRQNRNAIGYDGLGYVTPDQKTVAIASAAGAPYVLPSAATVIDGTYPVSRPLFMYTAGEPAGGVKEFLDFVTGDGQRPGDRARLRAAAGRRTVKQAVRAADPVDRVRDRDRHPGARLLHHRLRAADLPVPPARGSARAVRGAARQPLRHGVVPDLRQLRHRAAHPRLGARDADRGR